MTEPVEPGTESVAPGAPLDEEPQGFGIWLDGKAHLWWVFLVLTVVAMAGILAVTDFNYVSLELAGGLDAAAGLVEAEQVSEVRWGVIIDFGLIVAYSFTLLLGCRWIRPQYYSRGWQRIGIVLGWSAFGAGILLDTIENIALLVYLSDMGSATALIAAASVSWPKWVLLALAVAYLLAGLLIRAARVVGRTAQRRGTGGGIGLLPVDLGAAEEMVFWGAEKEKDADGTVGYEYQPKKAQAETAVPPGDDEPVIAICSSGGGVRSAAYNLGALQALHESFAAAGRTPRYHTAVSGGAYIAGARAIVDEHLGGGAEPAFAPGTPEEQNFRHRGNYVAPTTVKKLGGIARILLGLGFSVLFIGSILVLLARPWGALVSSEVLYPDLQSNVPAMAVAALSVADEADRIVHIIGVVEAEEAEDVEPETGALVATQPPAGLVGAGLDLLDAAESLATETRLLAGDTEDDEDDVVPSVASGPVEDLRIRGTAIAAGAVVVGCNAVGDLEETPPEDVCTGVTIEPFDPAPVSQAAEELANSATRLADEAARQTRIDIPVENGWWPIGVTFALAALVGLVSVGIPAVEGRRPIERLLQEVASVVFATGIFLVLTIVVLPWIFTRGWDTLIDGAEALLATAGISTAVFVAGAIRVLNSPKSSVVAGLAGALLAPLLALLAVIGLAGAGASEGLGGSAVWMAVALVVLIVIYLFADLNSWSIHPFYSRRLRTVYAVKRIPDGVEIIDDDEARLSAYDGDEPELIVCAAANVGDEGATPAGRDATSFMFSAKEVGGPGFGPVATKDLEDRLGRSWKSRITLPAAVAMSGAAFSPSMGKATRPGVRALLALTNLRTGVWLPNLNYVQAQVDAERRTGERQPQWVARPKASYLLKEIFGVHREEDPYVYITDGGHWENLGLAQALALHNPQPTEIWVLDAAGNQPDEYTTLGEALAVARTEPGIGIDPGFDPLSIRGGARDEEDDGKPIISPTDHVVHQFDIGPGRPATLIYCKAAVTASAPWDVKAYQESNPVFPSQPTLDQFFDYEQFEAYRKLGHHTASRALASLAQARELEAGGLFKVVNGRIVPINPVGMPEPP